MLLMAFPGCSNMSLDSFSYRKIIKNWGCDRRKSNDRSQTVRLPVSLCSRFYCLEMPVDEWVEVQREPCCPHSQLNSLNRVTVRLSMDSRVQQASNWDSVCCCLFVLLTRPGHTTHLVFLRPQRTTFDSCFIPLSFFSPTLVGAKYSRNTQSSLDL